METTGGAVRAGEDSLTAALREATEELRLIFDPKEGTLFHHIARHGDDSHTWLQETWIFGNDCPIDDDHFQEKRNLRFNVGKRI